MAIVYQVMVTSRSLKSYNYYVLSILMFFFS